MNLTIWKPALEFLLAGIALLFSVGCLALALIVWDELVIDRLLRTLGIGCEWIAWCIERRRNHKGWLWRITGWRAKNDGN